MKQGGLWLCVLILSALCSCPWVSRVAAQSNSTEDEEIVADTNGLLLRYGSNNTFDIKIYNETTFLVYGFYFGLGDPNEVVETDTPLSLGASGSLVVCQNGTGVNGFQGTTPPQDGLFIIRHNSTSAFYTLHLANSSTTGIQFGLSAQPIFSCTPNATSTPIQFMYDLATSSPPSSSHSLSPFLPLLYSLLSLCLVLSSTFSF